jgi:hypothetical protein
MPFSSSFGRFCEESTQVPIHEQLAIKTGFFQSSPVKPGQDKSSYFLNQHVRQSITQIPYHFSQVFAFCDPNQPAICRGTHHRQLAMDALLPPGH